jgi:hypothetical protein
MQTFAVPAKRNFSKVWGEYLHSDALLSCCLMLCNVGFFSIHESETAAHDCLAVTSVRMFTAPRD